MLFPDIKELLDLGRRASGVTLVGRRRAVSALSGDYQSPFRGRGLEFEEVREYVTGDDVRNIDWRVTARTGVPYLKLYSEDRERSVIVCIDRNDSMRFGTRGTFKSVQAARVAALIGWATVQEGNRLGASVFGNVPDGMRFFGPRRSRRSLWRMFNLLCDPQEYYPQPVMPGMHLKSLSRAVSPGSMVFVISDFMDLDQHLKKSLSNLHRRADVVLVAVNDPSDSKFSKAGAILFSGKNAEKVEVDTDDPRGAQAYERQWLENRAALDGLVNALGLGFVQIYTNSDVRTDLMTGLRRIGKTGARSAGHARRIIGAA